MQKPSKLEDILIKQYIHSFALDMPKSDQLKLKRKIRRRRVKGEATKAVQAYLAVLGMPKTGRVNMQSIAALSALVKSARQIALIGFHGMIRLDNLLKESKMNRSEARQLLNRN